MRDHECAQAAYQRQLEDVVDPNGNRTPPIPPSASPTFDGDAWRRSAPTPSRLARRKRQIVRDCLRERAERPATTNPHLRVTYCTAFDERHRPISVDALSGLLRQHGRNARQLRYVRAAHPERAALPPR